ncbi:DUF899 domain-containing protein [Trinickia mobilis]|uniref:DUF899 domain-containing protein n=1 Tax=Trinickia mobilis TaxID=2816356 RepID=UPI002868113D|nr:thioredoxin family protein [Trinickia mobilis]
MNDPQAHYRSLPPEGADASLGAARREASMETHEVVSSEAWIAARKALLKREKELTRARDALAQQRRELPWVKLDKTYVFDGPNGKETLADLFGQRSQLIVQHFMFGPDWQEGCTGCSFMADHLEGVLMHLNHRDVSFVAISRAPLAKLDAYKKRMNWHFKWVSSLATDFNQDFHVSFTPETIENGHVVYNYEACDFDGDEYPGISVFYKNEAGEVFHTYSTFARGTEAFIGTYSFLDLVPKGREENGPGHNLMDWVKRHDSYGDAAREAS